MKWEDLREEEFDSAIERSGGLCILPLGCIEKHGQHLPVGCDSLMAHGIATLAAEMEEAVVFPTGMWLGDVTGYHSRTEPERLRNRGGIGISTHTLLTVLEELCDEIARNGFRKILIFNGHGGNNTLMSMLGRGLGYVERDYAYMTLFLPRLHHWEVANTYESVLARREEFSYLTGQDMEALKEWSVKKNIGGHADWRETAVIYGLHPELVAPDKFDAESGESRHRSDYLSKLGVNHSKAWSVDYPNAYSGIPPFGCSANIGKATVQLLAEDLAKIIKVLKEDEECVRMVKDSRTPEKLFG